MFTVIVTLDVHPDRLETFTEGIRVNAEATLRDEPGCIRFDVHRSEESPNRFHFYEIYVDRESFEIAHRAAPHYAAWKQVAAECVIDGTWHNIYASPLFPDSIPERLHPTSLSLS
ncbi:putative quinol monooxygenase [Rathayibacter sp. VKM Ac-2801]|uniref:putative quinol monooxygenase n=1 Tax=Rathayibacter sp. VKM Ac-2801 TaxID=2609255 RepID=UPI00132044D7|nr:putative quinol monooxygenase [Rathayibacter sp. VKM Ac-2801]QHC71733.1 antibiotic biosynthesis monooxygenase [Rathayibacter sp. VKM Ac-2801]